MHRILQNLYELYQVVHRSYVIANSRDKLTANVKAQSYGINSSGF